MNPQDIRKLRRLTTFESLVDYLRDELDWPIEVQDAEDIVFEYEPEELGLDPQYAVKTESIKQVRPLGARGIQLRIAALGEAASVAVTPHVLRFLREVKTDLVTVAALLGHSSVATTAIYTQPNEQDLSAAVAGLA